MSWTVGDTITAALLNAMMPVGTILLYGGTSAPTGWLLCNGNAVSRTTYSELFAVLSTSYGVGDGSTTFNVPDFLGRTVIGTGSGSGLTARSRGDKSGEETHAITIAELASHSHTYDFGNNNAGAIQPSSNNEAANSTTARNTNSTGSGTAHNNMQPYGVATYIIKT